LGAGKVVIVANMASQIRFASASVVNVLEMTDNAVSMHASAYAVWWMSVNGRVCVGE